MRCRSTRARQMNLSVRLAGASSLLVLALAIAPGALPGAPAKWQEWGPIASAHAYKVEKVCEEKQTKKGLVKKCKSILVPESDKKEQKKKDVPASDKKDAQPKKPPAGAPAKH